MSIPEKVQLAIDTINEYRKVVSNELSRKSYTCMCCKTASLKILYADEKIHPLEQEKQMWANGTVSQVAFGYGSIYDTDSFYVAICDNCITSALDAGIIVKLRDIRQELEKINNKEIFPE